MSTRLRYENTMDDTLAFLEFHYAHSPTIRKQRSQLRWGASLCVFLMAFTTCLALSFVQHSPIDLKALMISCSLGAVLMFLLMPALTLRSMRRNSRRLFAEGKQQGLLGEHLLEIENDGLTERTDVNETKTLWRGMEQVAATKTHTFIYVTSLSALIIPHDRITEGNLQEFVQDVEHHLAFAGRLPA